VNLRRAAALLPIPSIFAAGAVASRLLLARAPRRIALDLAQPYVIVTGWGGYGSAAFALLAATLGAATIALAIAARALVRSPRRGDAAAVVAIAALTLAAGFAWPFAFSSDPYAYAAYGAMVRDGLDPYALLPASAHGPFYAAARWQWSGTYPVCVYGPAFVALAAGFVTVFGGSGVGATLWALRIAGAGAFLAGVVLLWAALRDRPARERFVALYAYGLNPAVLWAVVEGHNDVWLLLVALGAAALARTRPRCAAVVLGASLAVKAPGAAFACAAALDGRLRRRPGGAALVAYLGAGLAPAALVCAVFMRPALASLGAHGKYAPAVSVQGLLGPVASITIALAAAGFGAVHLARGSRTGYAWLGIALLAGLPNGYPWYALWLVPFAVAAGPGRTSLALWAATICSVMRYLPDAAGDLDPVASKLAALVATLPLLLALGDLPGAAFRKKVSAQS
jgi:hypothetical protein